MIYESDENREDQDRCAWVLEHMGYQVTQSPREKVLPWDMALKVENVPVALVEFKAREVCYPTLIIDQKKIDGLIDLSSKHNVHPLLIIHWRKLGGYWAWKCHRNSLVEVFKRNKARGIPGEEPESPDLVYHVKRNEFNKRVFRRVYQTADNR